MSEALSEALSEAVSEALSEYGWCSTDPQWKETMFMPIDTPDGRYVPSSLEQVPSSIPPLL